jgi:hypothetical protein
MSGSVGSPQAIAAPVLFRPSDQPTSGSSDLSDLGQGCTRDWKSSSLSRVMKMEAAVVRGHGKRS